MMVCANTEGSVHVIHKSYRQNGVLLLIFADIDECQVSNTTCINADCVNEIGSYYCGPCYPGFKREIPNSNLTACGKSSPSFVIK